jgi:thymidylate kinase
VRTHGTLYVFEGPDGVGKTELSRRFAAQLEAAGVPCEYLSFPGHDDGTLGKHVYELHHDPGQHGVASVSPTSLQLLHIAAHIDAIESRILPALRSGRSVVLDRFWWSTKVYGLASGVARRTLNRMIDIELAAWGGVKPAALYLVGRHAPLRPEPIDHWQRCRELYDSLAEEEGRSYPVRRIDNGGSIEEALRLLAPVDEDASAAELVGSGQLPLDLASAAPAPPAPCVFSGIAPAVPTPVFDTYWHFAAERQAIFFKRQAGTPPPWTNDPILREYKFTNAYRASDRVSQFLIKYVIYEGDQAPEEVFFRILLFKLFNKIETWRLLMEKLGALRHAEYSFTRYDDVLSAAIAAGQTIYSAAYIMPSGSWAFGSTRKHRAHLHLLERMMEDELPLRIAEARTMLNGFNLLRSYPMIGDFLAYQYITDLNYSNLTDFSETEFVVPGPGARSGIQKCFASLGGLSEADLIRVVTDRQGEEFARLGLDFRSLWGRPLQLIDCQNLFCEVDKYARVKHPEVEGIGQRTRIKQKFNWNPTPIEYCFPPKWRLDERVAAGARGNGERGEPSGAEKTHADL